MQCVWCVVRIRGGSMCAVCVVCSEDQGREHVWYVVNIKRRSMCGV